MFFFFLLFHVILSMEAPECWRGGHMNETSGYCDCPWGWKNIEGRKPGQCASRDCCGGDGPDEHNICHCPYSEWWGVNCDMCTHDSSCQEFPHIYSNVSKCRNHSMVSYQNMRFQCAVQEQIMIDLIGSNTSFACDHVGYGPDTGFPNVCYIQAWTLNDTGYQGETFWCNLYNCTQAMLPHGKIKYSCDKSWCECDLLKTGNSRCEEPQIKFIIDHMRGSSYVECEMDGKCTFKHQDFPSFVEMNCHGAECADVVEPPPPHPPPGINWALYITLTNSVIVLWIFIIVLTVVLVFECCLRRATKKEYNRLQEFGAVGGKLEIRELNYYVKVWKEKRCWKAQFQILHGISHVINPGEVVAIMGASGAGKTTLLDILAHRNKTGMITGTLLFNDKKIGRSFKRMTGYVLQEDCLMATMTVKETIRFSADLRLPTCISSKRKNMMVEDVMRRLKISHIANRYIGDEMTRGISGGEKKRVSIAAELIIEPHVLFLDEPTSGLDAASAFLVIKQLVQLAKEDGRTIVFSIHQPRSNIFKLFDDLLLLSKGRIMYAGKANLVVKHFVSMGYEFPKNENPADWLIDIITDEEKREEMQQMIEEQSKNRGKGININEQTSLIDDEEENDQVFTKNEMDNNDNDYQRLSSDNAENMKGDTNENLKLGFQEALEEEEEEDGGEIISLKEEPQRIWGESMIPYATPFFSQCYTLSKRALKNFLRNFYLAPAHFLSAFAMGTLIGAIYWQEKLNIAGCQNRLGSIFFMLCLLSFTAMSSLEIFIKERPIYVRERANGYYYPISYFLSKVLFDIIPLRVFPPIIMSCCAYFLIDLRITPFWHFPMFVLLMVVFNVTAGSMCILIGTISSTVAQANIVATLSILVTSLFAGFLLNHTLVPKWIGWIRYLSYWNYIFEAFVINEFLGVRVLIDANGMPPYMTDGMFYLNELGMNQRNFVVDIIVVALFGIFFLVLSGGLLQFCIKERR